MILAQWSADVDAFVRAFGERAALLDLEDSPTEPWTDPDHPDGRLDAAYRSGIVPPERRWGSDFIDPGPGAASDSITVLRGIGGLLAKRVHLDGRIVDYDNVLRFDMWRVHHRGLADLRGYLQWLIERPDHCIVRGAIVGGDHFVCSRLRRLHPREGEPATLREVPRRWLALDFDGWPDNRRADAGDLLGAAALACSVLPGEFHDADCIVAATASHGFKPGLRVRLWFWLSRPVAGDELRYWLRNAAVDPSVFVASQPIYTAAPAFIDRPDPLRQRLAWVTGVCRQVDVPDAEALKLPPRPAAKPVKAVMGLSPYATAALDSACRRIVSAPDGQQERTLNREAYAIGTLAAAGGIPGGFARDALLWAARQMPDHDGRHPWLAAEVDRKVNAAFAAGLHHPRKATNAA
jgi:hypothetical protein